MNLNLASILAQAQAPATPPPDVSHIQPPPAPESIPPAFIGRFPLQEIWKFILDMRWPEAVVLIAFGMIYLIYGWRIFKALVVINFAIFGLAGGILIGKQLGSTLWAGLLGTALFGTISLPFLKYSVSVLGAGAGGVLGALLWRTAGLPEGLIWCGGMGGLIAGGFMAFSSFKVSIMLFSSLQGAMLVIVGVLSLFSALPQLTVQLTQAVYNHVALLPCLIMIPTMAGIYFQQRLIKMEAKWAIPT